MVVRPFAPLIRGRQLAAWCACLLLGACASLPDEKQAPEQTNYTPFPFTLLQAEDGTGTYWSVVTKITYDVDEQGRLSLADTGEPLLGEQDDPAKDLVCQPYGGGENQRTSWFPYTGLFVKGGEVSRVLDSRGAPQPLRPMREDGDGRVRYDGAHAREPEYTYVPCVGDQRVDHGVRLDAYLPEAARLEVRDDTGLTRRLALPALDQPLLFLGYRSGRLIPLPMRPVLATVDLPARRLVLQYQTTFSADRRLERVEYRFVSTDGVPSEGESLSRYRERTEALMNDLRHCPPPTRVPREACGDPARRPDPLIFSPGS